MADDRNRLLSNKKNYGTTSKDNQSSATSNMLSTLTDKLTIANTLLTQITEIQQHLSDKHVDAALNLAKNSTSPVIKQAAERGWNSIAVAVNNYQQHPILPFKKAIDRNMKEVSETLTDLLPRVQEVTQKEKGTLEDQIQMLKTMGAQSPVSTKKRNG